MWMDVLHTMLTKRSQEQKAHIVLFPLYRMGRKCEKSKWWFTLVGSDLKGGVRGPLEILGPVLSLGLCAGYIMCSLRFVSSSVHMLYFKKVFT